MVRYKYSRWDGSQQVFDPDHDQIIEELSDDVLAHGDIMRALREMFQRGMGDQKQERIQGLRELMERLKEQRQQQLQRYNLDSVMQDLKERLEQIIDTERKGIDRRVQEARQQLNESPTEEAQQMQEPMKLLQERADKGRELLDNLPESPGGQIRELNEYDFMDEEARRMFQELLDMLNQRMMENLFQDMRQQLQGMTPEQMEALKDMLSALNQMLGDAREGRDPGFESFMQQYGHLFGPNPPQSLEDLLEGMNRQMSQMDSLLNSMSPQMRQELEELLDAALDQETLEELEELAAQMGALFPRDDLRNEFPFMGDESLTLDQAMELMRQLQDMDELEKKIREVGRKGNIQDLDPGKVEEVLGEEARRNLERMQRIVQQLEEAGYLKRQGDRLELTPRGIKKLALKALKEVFAQLKKDRIGSHDIYTRGFSGEHSGETKIFEFGDPFDVDFQKTLMNAITREGPATPVRLDPKDLEIHYSENMAQAATILLLDQSRSMGLYGSFLAAKKVALALYYLIRSQFPRDKFHVIGFSDYAMEIKGDDLPELTWNAWVSGTNMHHALMLSRQLLHKAKVATKQIIMITDGEPTAHLEGTRAYFAYPPSYRTIQETLKEVKRCTQAGITINTFMLESTYDLLDFVDKMTRINKGRAFFTTPDKLGQFVLVDYMSNRRKRLN